MSSIFLFWIGLVVGFIVIELVTATFYGLSLALASSIVAIYVYFFGDGTSQIVQALIFAISSAIFAYILPKYLVSKTPDMPQGLDQYIGKNYKIKLVGSEKKIVLDGVDYPIETEDEISVGDTVKVTGHKGISLMVEKVSEKSAKK